MSDVIELMRLPVMYPEYVMVVKEDQTIALTWVKTKEDNINVLRFINTLENVSVNQFLSAFKQRVHEFLDSGTEELLPDIQIDLDMSER